MTLTDGETQGDREIENGRESIGHEGKQDKLVENR